MRDNTRELFNAMMVSMANTYGVETVAQVYTVQPSVEQKLIDKIIESDAFLNEINFLFVDEIKGQKVLGSANIIKGKRTDVENNDRVPQNLLRLTKKDYELFNTEYDVALPWVTIDSWAKFPDFQDRYGNYVRKAIALSRIRTGWHGVEAASETDNTKMMGEDTNKGWFQLLREFNGGSQFFTKADGIKIGSDAGHTYRNIDAAVHDLKALISPEHRSSTMQVFIGDDLIHDEKARLYAAHGTTPTEKEREKIESSITTFAGIARGITPAHFPDRAILITDPKNLSIYVQSGSIRRQQKDKSERSRVEDFNSANEGYVIENEEAAAALDFDQVKLYTGSAWE